MKVFLGIPVADTIEPAFMQSLLKLINDPPCPLAMRMNPGEAPISEARNGLTAAFLASDCTDLLFIDSDIVFEPEQVDRLLSRDADVVGGLYAKKRPGPPAWVINAYATPFLARADGLQRVAYMGTGFLRVRRSVFERMIARYGAAIAYTPDSDAGDPRPPRHNLWPIGLYDYPDGSRRMLTEDWFFCQRCAELGIEVWADPSVQLKHVGQVAFPIRG